MSSESERFACASMSTSTTRRPCRASAAPRLAQVVVLPTPPFWLITAIRRIWGRSLARQERVEARQRSAREQRLAEARPDALAVIARARLDALQDVRPEQEMLPAVASAPGRDLARVAAHQLELALPDRADVDDQRGLEGQVAHEVVQTCGALGLLARGSQAREAGDVPGFAPATAASKRPPMQISASSGCAAAARMSSFMRPPLFLRDPRPGARAGAPARTVRARAAVPRARPCRSAPRRAAARARAPAPALAGRAGSRRAARGAGPCPNGCRARAAPSRPASRPDPPSARPSS